LSEPPAFEFADEVLKCLPARGTTMARNDSSLDAFREKIQLDPEQEIRDGLP
jgi:hypothetical protein